MYTPSRTILRRYADVLVNFALGEGKGINRGDTVYLKISEVARPLMVELRDVIAESGGNLILSYLPSDETRSTANTNFYKYASQEQLEYVPHRFLKGLIEDADHSLLVFAETDPALLNRVDPEMIVAHSRARLSYREYYRQKEDKGGLTWSLALYATPYAAKEAGMSLETYWGEIIKGCYLNKKDPVAEWKKVHRNLAKYKKKLDSLKIDKLHVQSKDADLWIKIGKRRAWKYSQGHNIPSFELFTSPDWRGTEGWICLNQPLVSKGSRIEGIRLEFKKGKVVKAKAKKNQKLLDRMLATKNMDKVGEFSLTDKRMSKVTKFMAHTLFDENVGGPQGNTHIALGSAYKDCFDGDHRKIKKKTWRALGYNESPDHVDVISTERRKVTAYIPGGKEKVIYKDGKFTL